MNRRVRGYLVCASAAISLLIFGWGFAGCGSSGAEFCLESGECEIAINVVKVSGEIPVDPNAPFWASLAQPVSVELGPQMITNPRWPDPSIKEVRIWVVHNGSEIGILLEWDDPTLESVIEVSATHTDQAAVMFPLTPGPELPPITMGGENMLVNIWQWKAAWQPSLSEKSRRGMNGRGTRFVANPRWSPVEDLTAEGFSTLTTQEEQDVLGRGLWKDKVWRVVFKRTLTNSDNADVQFGSSVPMAVAVWNGGNRERNGQKGLAGWILLRFA